MKEKIVAFIPIKLNNQRLPHKNTMLLCGKPLCSYLFEIIKDIELIDCKYVYCSDESFKFFLPDGITFLKRDKRLDGFDIRGLDIIESFLKDMYADIYVLAHVTSPFTKRGSLENALNKVLSGNHDSAFSAVKLQTYCWHGGKPVNYNLEDIAQTQYLEPVYAETSSFFIFRREVFTKYRRRIGKKPYIQIVDQFENIDVDTAEDFHFAEAVQTYMQSLSKVKETLNKSPL